jgi:penicillin-binding protein 1A
MMFGSGGKRSGRRIEPRFDDSAEDSGLRADPADRPPARRKGGKGTPEKKKRRRRRSLLGGLFYWTFVLGVWGVVALGGLFAYYASQLPPIDQLAVPKRPPDIQILGSDGSVIADRGDTGGAAVRLGDLPPYLPKAFVAIEDRRFYYHFGVDPVGIVRAVVSDLAGSGGVQGGSTLTQQLAKNLFLTQERTLSRKIQEAILALWLERKYSKDQILELYLNRVYFGSGAYGVQAAARKYFAKDAKDVSLSEAALLAGLMKSPTKLAPNRNLKGANERAAQVITAMAEQGYITQAMAKVALANPAEVANSRGSGSVNYAADYVMDALDDLVGAIDEDIVVTTTIDPRLQSAAERAVTGEIDARGARFNVSQGALVALDPDGGVKALVGGRNYAESQFNRAIAAKRQPGSSFKPFVYLAALEKGDRPDDVRSDAPINIKGWSPENFEHEHLGSVTLTKALAMSLNTVAVRLCLEVGPKAVVKVAHRLGVLSDLSPNASIALGTSEATPLEMVSAYAAFANGGIGVRPYVIMTVRTANGHLLYRRHPYNYGRVIEPRYVAMMNGMMQQTLAIGTARKADLPGWQAAGKTGTTQDFRDAWFIGFTSHLVAGVWLGNDDGASMKRVTGGTLPVEVWSRFMRDAHQGVPVAGLPLGDWRDMDAADPSAPQVQVQAQQPPAAVGAPMAINRIGAATASQPVGRGGDRDPGLIPPAPVGGGASAPPRRDKNLLEKLLGEL